MTRGCQWCSETLISPLKQLLSRVPELSNGDIALVLMCVGALLLLGDIIYATTI